MIIQENITVHGVDLVKTYSDLYLIKQVETGILYAEAIDVPDKYTYEETDELKPVNESEYELCEL
jgi:hypothetical protein